LSRDVGAGTVVGEQFGRRGIPESEEKQRSNAQNKDLFIGEFSLDKRLGQGKYKRVRRSISPGVLKDTVNALFLTLKAPTILDPRSHRFWLNTITLI
jgi:hypothetical protein